MLNKGKRSIWKMINYLRWGNYIQLFKEKARTWNNFIENCAPVKHINQVRTNRKWKKEKRTVYKFNLVFIYSIAFTYQHQIHL